MNVCRVEEIVWNLKEVNFPENTVEILDIVESKQMSPMEQMRLLFLIPFTLPADGL
jgi:hypothetical protein